ncbi:dTDP-4-dehydrorhamnose 3,5-epimerase [Leptospira yasudae]|uniref:dTDP-4-dehydrorhamnose 3,5-epimerase family protein n=1 Tax=Leptospira yasudae TaxID=2202201 RepID=UPI0010831F15|nr:dTDP-4-dehydrorhamnose 3,5-epimerase family protein [Leptospira yasudae]TGK24529.1 dTDP-4-dehydrorhamnose 3,5-epimerase [Leptospira yasudae]TGM05685.1 dTDP-4-dehydrorhamnose 3,5-epimerase [Leptospira yasudae]
MNSEILEGVVITPLKEIFDPKGSVLHMMRSDDSEYSSFGECYFSEVNPGSVKAWKFHKRQTQNFTVPMGRIKLVLYDNRDGSSTKGKIQELVLGRPDHYQRIKIPPRIWYGFTCVSVEKAFIVNFTDIPHDPSESERLPEYDSSIPFNWKP